MNRCIYSGAGEETESFLFREHIFPKCIGGTKCLPRGYVSDQTNNTLSKLEMHFSRSYPFVAVPKMFYSDLGRKKHASRDRILLLRNFPQKNTHSLGYIRNGIPCPINQIIITSESSLRDKRKLQVQIVLASQADLKQKSQRKIFWQQLCSFQGNVKCIKSKQIPERTYILGYKETCWYLGVSDSENPEIIKPKIFELVAEMVSSEAENILEHQEKIVIDSQYMEVSFSLEMNPSDILRVYGKIAVNCLAELKGHEFVLADEFSEIKQAILTGENIEKYVRKTSVPNPVRDVLRRYYKHLNPGAKYHSAVFMSEDGMLYCLISLFGLDNPYCVTLGRLHEKSYTDFFICDWENKRDFTMRECSWNEQL